ncbi:MAG TPA: protein kinase [Pseudomonadota bacterium]|nr:protein kinase [Pseudomonadota bacterium]
MADKFPRPFGRYSLLSPLAQGGMGALYLACTGDRGMERLCVIKTVLPHLADAEYVNRFRDEAKVVVRLSHGNLVPVFDAGMVDSELYLAMDYIDGKDLRAVWNRCAKKGIAFPIDVAVYIARELARGLHYAHTFGNIKLVHRDVSPPNVLVSFNGEVKLTDFGLASSTLKLEKTAAGIVYGKVSYMSPEQARGEPIDGRTDIYAAGIILWELLTGRQLFPTHSGDQNEVLERVRNPHIDTPSLRAPRIPAMLDQIVLRSLAKVPEQRYLTGEQFRADLTAFLASNREYVTTDAERVRAFMADLFDEDIERERQKRQELLEHVHERLQAVRDQEHKEREAAEQKAARRAEILKEIEKPSTDDKGRLREGEIPSQVLENLSAYETGKMLGTVIERWKILRKIGAGGMGRVFEAEHTEIGRKVAIKILHPVYSRTPELVARFRMEARAASKIGHPHIIEVTDSGTTVDGSFYFVMELLEGRDLAEWLKKEKRLPVADVLSVGCQVAQALSAAHQSNIIHRDLKPENIFLVEREGQKDFVKVLDFGIAKSLGDSQEQKLTTPGMAMGTPEYMAPEQATGKGADARVDVYSLGAILYETLSGKAPISGENAMDVLIRKATEDPENIGHKRTDMPADMVSLVMRMLSRSPDDRPQTMAEAAAEMQRILAAIRSGVLVVPSNPPVAPSSTDLSTVGSPKRRHLVLGSVGLAGGLVGLTAALYWVFTAPPPKVTLDAGQSVVAKPLSLDSAAPVPVPRPRDAGTDAGRPHVAANPPGKNNPSGKNNPPGKKDREDGDAGKKKPNPGLLTTSIEYETAVGKLNDGRVAIDRGQYGVAFDFCYAASGNAQARGQALACLGEADFGRSRFDDAIKWGKLAIKHKAATTEVLLLLGKSYARQKHCKEARMFFRKVLDRNSDHPEALRGLDVCKEKE